MTTSDEERPSLDPCTCFLRTPLSGPWHAEDCPRYYRRSLTRRRCDERLRAVLAFYADEANYRDGRPYGTPVDLDGGQRARDILTDTEGTFDG